MKAIKLIIVTIIQAYASMFGLIKEEKKAEPEQSYIFLVKSNELNTYYRFSAPAIQDGNTFIWHATYDHNSTPTIIRSTGIID